MPYVVWRVGDRSDTEDLTSKVIQHALAGLGRFEWRGIPLAAWLYRRDYPKRFASLDIAGPFEGD
jgi:DNA-directed RNA polymerase specialized sigma24 family protein